MLQLPFDIIFHTVVNFHLANTMIVSKNYLNSEFHLLIF